MNFKKNKGFTMVELIVVIAIIAILARVVIGGVMSYTAKGKIVRAKNDATTIEKALTLFYTKYGDYPRSQYSGIMSCPNPNNKCFSYIGPSAGVTLDTAKQTGDGWLNLSNCGSHDNCPHLSSFLPMVWSGPNATYYGSGYYYLISLSDQDKDGRIGCGAVILSDSTGTSVGQKNIICQDCPCGAISYQNTGIFAQ